MSLRPGDPPEQPSEGCWRIALPDPYPPGVVAVHLLEGPDGPWLLDTGPPGEDARAALSRGLAALGLDRDDLRGVLLSHHHLDHVGGLAGWRPARVRTHAATARCLAEAGDGADRTPELLRRAGVPGEALPQLERHREPRDPSLARRIRVDEPLEGEEGRFAEPEDWRWIRVGGHAPGHLLVHRPGDGTLLSSDQFMARLKTPLAVGDPDADPWGAYLRSLRRAVDADPRVILPAHTEPIRPAVPWLERRLRTLDRALDRIRAEVGRAADTAWAVLERLYPGSPSDGRRALLVRETLAGLRRLAATGDLEREVTPEGVERYRPT